MRTTRLQASPRVRQRGFAKSSARVAALALLLIAAPGCRTPTTQVIVEIDSDAVPSRALLLEVHVRHHGATGVDPTPHDFARGDAGTLQLPASFTVVPASGDALNEVIDLEIDATLASGSDAVGDYHFRRTARFALTPHATVRVPIFLAVGCGVASTACTTTPADECTVGALCEEHGLTCGDDATCVPVDVPTRPVSDAGLGFDHHVIDVPGPDDVADVVDAQTCPIGQSLCGGTCIDTRSDPMNCGTCGNDCQDPPNASPSCVAGACAALCDHGFADCDHALSNGCEASLASPMSCGACGNACSGATPLCGGSTTDGGVATHACASGCMPSAPTRCGSSCVDLQTDVDNCGACGRVCVASANASRVCAIGVCGTTCHAGFGDCDSNPMTGCETNVATSASNCGRCGAACPSLDLCTGGMCACPASDRVCSGVCVDLASDDANCGSCGHACVAPMSCSYGACGGRMGWVDGFLSRLNAARTAACPTALVYDSRLSAAAQRQAADMGIHDFGGPLGSDGSDATTRVMDTGFTRFPPLEERHRLGSAGPTAAVDWMMNDAYARAAIVDCTNRTVGVGFFYDASDTANVTLRYTSPATFGNGPFFYYWVIDLTH